MAEERIKLTFEGDTADLVTKIKAIPGVTEKEAQRMAIALEKGMRKAAKATNKEATSIADSLKKVGQGLGFGGAINDLEDLTSGLGGMGVAAMGGAVAIAGAAGLVAAIVGLEAAAGAALDRIEELNLQEIVTAEQTANVRDANDAMESMSIAADAVTVALASGLAPAVTSTATALVEMELFTSKVIATLDTGALSINSWTSLLGAVVVGGITPFIDGLLTVHRFLGTDTDAMEGFAASLHELGAGLADNAFAIQADTAAQREALALTTDAEVVIGKVTAARSKSAKATAETTKALKEEAPAVAAAAAAYDEHLAVMQLFAEADARASEERYQAAIQAEEALRAAREESAAQKKQLAEEGAATMVSLQQDVLNQTLAFADQIAAQAQAHHEEELARIRGRIDANREKLEAALANGHTERAEKLKNMIAEDRAEAQAQKKAAKRAHAAQKAVAITGIAISTAQATMALLASPAIAALGPGAPGAAAALAIASGVLQAAAVAATPAPKFHTGRSPDEVQATLTRQEAVLSPRAVQAVGGAQGVDALNRGTGGIGMPPALYLSIDGRAADRIATTALRSGRDTALALRSAKSEPVGSGHYGRR